MLSVFFFFIVVIVSYMIVNEKYLNVERIYSDMVVKNLVKIYV